MALFSRPPVSEKTKSQLQVVSLKNDCSLFSRLYVASQVRNGNLDEFFEHENQAYPPALSQNGKLRTGTKSDLVSCLEELVNSRENATHPSVEVIILDGSVIVNMLRPGSAKTFSDYASQVFLPYVASQLQQASRIDIVWDEYRPDSLKAETRVKRGKGVRRRVEASTPIPGNWQEFLRTDENKVELFSFLANRVPYIETEKQVLSTIQSNIVCTQSKNVSRLTPCTHEEADTRIILHLEDAVTEGFNKISIRTVDTDVVVLAVAAAQRHGNTEIWIAFGTGKSFRFLAAHEMARILGPDRCIALPMFHAFTGCDTVSFFGGRGKRTAWDTWRSYNDITSIFVSLTNTPVSFVLVIPVLRVIPVIPVILVISIVQDIPVIVVILVIPVISVIPVILVIPVLQVIPIIPNIPVIPLIPVILFIPVLQVFQSSQSSESSKSS